MGYKSDLIVAPSKKDVPEALNAAIVETCAESIQARGIFSIALSGGSNVSFMASLPDAFEAKGVDPNWSMWHVILADERVVPMTDADSNMGALQDKVFSKVAIPASQVHGINEEKLSESTAAIAEDYELIVRSVIAKSGGQLDMAVLGFGPDGHTCSLFPNHALLKEETNWVASLDDSPKPPPRRITLTYPVLNQHVRHVVFCGAGGSKSPILKQIFESVASDNRKDAIVMRDPAPFPCGAVRPKGALTWVVDQDAMEGIERM